MATDLALQRCRKRRGARPAPSRPTPAGALGSGPDRSEVGPRLSVELRNGSLWMRFDLTDPEGQSTGALLPAHGLARARVGDPRLPAASSVGCGRARSGSYTTIHEPSTDGGCAASGARSSPARGTGTREARKPRCHRPDDRRGLPGSGQGLRGAAPGHRTLPRWPTDPEPGARRPERLAAPGADHPRATPRRSELSSARRRPAAARRAARGRGL